jgi:hypothetical protein
MKRTIVLTLCTAFLGASAAATKNLNSLGNLEGVPELQGLGGVAAVTVLGAVGYGVSKIYNKIVHRNRE